MLLIFMYSLKDKVNDGCYEDQVNGRESVICF